MPSETAARLPHALPKAPDPLSCPRCQSVNTKFCYYNNYNLSQPRHFCKSCRRYWTRGGALRNVPVGGATRKNSKRCRSSSTTATTAATTKVFAPIPGPEREPVLLASNVEPDFSVLKREKSWDNLNPNDYQCENFVSLPSIAQQVPGFLLGYGLNGFGYGVFGYGEPGDEGEMLNGDCVGWPRIAISMPPKV